jgi:hypothetical protein
VSSGRQRLLVAAAALSVGATRFIFRARVPDDYDSIGFVRALDQFDLAKLQPHFPGYPVYVALAKSAHALIADPLLAATLVSSVASAVTTAALYTLAGPFALALYAAAWLPWLLGGAALAESTAIMFAALAFACVSGRDGVNTSTCSRARLVAGGLAMGVMLGTRASYWPLVVSFLWLVRSRLAPAALGLIVGIAVWLVPFVAITPQVFTLGRTHLSGHFGTWGGSVVTQPNVLARLFAFARGLFYDGFAPMWPLSIALAVLVIVCRPRPARRMWIVAVPYALWALLAQNVMAQPRHLLPLVVIACVALGLLFQERRYLGVVATVVMLAASLPLAWARAHGDPAAARAARWVASHYAPRDVAVIGGRSIRFFELLTPELVARQRALLSEVDVEATRLDRLPPEILVTDELETDPDRLTRLGEAITFCRDPRIDRGQPCLSLKPYRISFGRP